MKNYLIFFSLFILVSCSKEKELKDAFVDKIWVVDSVKSRTVDYMAQEKGTTGGGKRTWNNILKPISSGQFDIYKDQTPIFNEYKISNDTLYLKNSSDNIFRPYKFEKVNDYTYKAEALGEIIDEYAYYMTDLTDLFNNKINNKSDLYNKIKNFTWYPIENWELGKKVYEDNYPDYYIADAAFAVYKDTLLFHNNTFPEGSRAKFTNNGLYVFDPKEQKLVWVFNIEIKDNYFEIVENNTRIVKTKYKKIDKTILKNRDDLPKKIRLNCSQEIARLIFEEWLKEDVNSSFYYDLKTVKLINSDDDECRYFFTVINRSRQFYDIYSTYKYVVYYTEEGDVNIEKVR